MADHTEILEAALEALGEGIVVLDGESKVLVWNHAATAISGHPSADLIGRKLPVNFYQIDPNHHGPVEATSERSESGVEHPVLVNLRHKQGHSLPAMLHRTPLRDELGKRFGTLLRFHPMEDIDSLPHGESDAENPSDNRLEQSQSGVEDRLDDAFREWKANAVPFGVMWVTVDQAAMLRKTHGRDASEAMLSIVERTLLHGLRPTQILGRWGVNEFLVICHERSAEMLENHARYLAGLARTADFRWWGDRVSLTVSVGVGQAENSESLSCLLLRAQNAMQQSIYAGGNHVTNSVAREISGEEERECSQS
jgi:diguanylate cyclase (GGDEF)-like protein/PAS domain S-box-containing protein